MQETSLLGKILIVIYGVAVVAFTIMSSVIYIYTIYYYAVDDGFLGAAYGMFLPGLSSVTLFFKLVGLEGLFNNFTIMILIWLCTGAIFGIPLFISSKNT